MRCRKVRSCLSAYCKNELTDKRQASLKEHLDRCADCRREEAVFRELFGSMNTLPKPKVSEDFNTRLLNRIAQERFKETRTKAYMPKKAPVMGWGRLVPAMATVCLVLAFVFTGGIGTLDGPDQPAQYADNGAGGEYIDDRYKDVQPEETHVLTQHSNSNWAFQKQVAKANRIRNLMNQLATQSSFSNTAQLAGSSYNYNRALNIRLPFDRRTLNSTYTTQGAIIVEEAR